MGLGQAADDALDILIRVTKSGASVVDDGAKAADDLANTAKAATAAKAGTAGNAAGDATTATAKTADGAADASKGGFLDWTKRHKLATGIGAAGLGAAGLVGYGMLTGDDAPKTAADYAPILTAPGGLIDSAKDAVGLGDSANGGIVKMDPDVVRGLAAALRTQADNAAALVTSAPDAFTAYRAWLTRDLLGAPTRDNKASPVVGDFDAALVDAEKRYIAVAQGLSQQFEGDAVKLERLATEWEDMEAENAAALTSVNGAVQSTTSPSTPTPTPTILA